VVEADASLGPLPSYPTLRRALKARGLVRRRRSTDHRAENGPREVRSFEMSHAHALCQRASKPAEIETGRT
jgi:hypothetical protein